MYTNTKRTKMDRTYHLQRCLQSASLGLVCSWSGGLCCCRLQGGARLAALFSSLSHCIKLVIKKRVKLSRRLCQASVVLCEIVHVMFIVRLYTKNRKLNCIPKVMSWFRVAHEHLAVIAADTADALQIHPEVIRHSFFSLTS